MSDERDPDRVAPDGSTFFFNQKDLRDADERVRLLFRARDSLKSRGKCFCDDCVKELANIQEAYQREYDGAKMPDPEENADRPAVDWNRVHAVAIRDDDGRVRVYPPERAEIILTGGPDSTGGLTEERPAGSDTDSDGPYEHSLEAFRANREELAVWRGGGDATDDGAPKPGDSEYVSYNTPREWSEDRIVKLVRSEILKYKADDNGYFHRRRDVN